MHNYFIVRTSFIHSPPLRITFNKDEEFQNHCLIQSSDVTTMCTRTLFLDDLKLFYELPVLFFKNIQVYKTIFS
jgi:hypothetical protein